MIPIMVLHALICIFLIIVILIQPGRHGGLTESMAAAESLFGSQTNAFMVKTTTILAAFFLITCLSLAFFSAKQNKSLMSGRTAAGTASKEASLPVQQPAATAPTTPAEAAPAVNPASEAEPAPAVADPAPATQ